MIGVTLFCIVCGLAWNYPQASLAYALLLALFLPTVIVCQILVTFSRERMTTLIVSLIGAAIVVVFDQPVILMGSPRTAWQCIEPMIVPMVIGPPLGALVFGVLADEFLKRRRGD
jgi:hypothetical protein